MKIIKIAEITRIRSKAIKEAQRELNKVFGKYSKQIEDVISKQLPKGYTFNSWNGMCNIEGENREIIAEGNWWSRYDNGDPTLEKLASYQYSIDRAELDASFNLPQTIKSKA